MTKKTAEDMVIEELNYKRDNIEVFIKEIDSISMTVFSEKRVIDSVNYYSNKPYIKQVAIAKNKQDPWFLDAVKNNGTGIWAGNGDELIYVRAIDQNDVVYISIDSDYIINNFFKTRDQKIPTYFSILDGYGHDLFHQKNYLTNDVLKEVKKKKDGHFIVEINDISYFMVHTQLNGTDWIIFAFVPYQELTKDLVQAKQDIFFYITITIIFSMIVSIFISLSLTKPIISLVKDINKIKDGNLTIKSKVNSKDEIGFLAKSFNKMVDNLSFILRNILHTSKNLDVSMKEISDHASKIKSSSFDINVHSEIISFEMNHQDTIVKNGFDILDNLNVQINKVLDSIEYIDESSTKTKEITDHSKKTIKSLTNETNEGSIRIQEVIENIQNLTENSDEISSITEHIKNISKQTNLLALNANMEASRAGVHGKGFSVVALEVRKLADQTKKALDQIDDAISKTQEKINNVSYESSKIKKIYENQQIRTQQTELAFNQMLAGFSLIETQLEHLKTDANKMKISKQLINESFATITSGAEKTLLETIDVTKLTEIQNIEIQELVKQIKEMEVFIEQLKEKTTPFMI
jgi:methyl-accepting chemotaxis protein